MIRSWSIMAIDCDGCERPAWHYVAATHDGCLTKAKQAGWIITQAEPPNQPISRHLCPMCAKAI